MKVTRLGWMGAKTQRFEKMNEFYRDVLGLDVLSIDDSSGRFKLQDGTEVHVYGPKDKHHEFFSEGPVVAFEVNDFAVAQSRYGMTSGSAAATPPSRSTFASRTRYLV